MLVEVMLAVCLCLVGLLFLFTPYKWRSRKSWELINRIPGPPAWPIIGTLMELRIPHEEFLPLIIRLSNEYGPVVRMVNLGVFGVFLTDPDDIEIIMNNKQHISKSLAYKFLQPWLGTGLLTSTGNKWQTRRKILTPAFHFQVLQDYVPVFNANSAILVDKLRTQIGADHVDMAAFITLCTLDIICETAMGTSVNAQTAGDVEYIDAVKRMGESFQNRTLSFWLHNDFIFHRTQSGRDQKKVLKMLHSFTGKVIKERRAEYRAKQWNTPEDDTHKRERKKLTFLDVLIEVAEREGSLNDEDIQEEVDTFMFEGHDTTSAAVTWTLFLLGSNPDVQEKAAEELSEMFGSDRRQPTMADLLNMTYLDKVIKESLRLYPSVPAISRKIDEDVQIKNYLIPAGTNVPMIPFLLHRNPEIFPEPERFDPERFSPEQSSGRHPFAYLPFSAGPRNCIGQKFARLEEKAMLSSILRNFKIESLDKKEDIKLMMEMILKPKDPLKFKLSLREQMNK